jgi:hypothetical protein
LWRQLLGACTWVARPEEKAMRMVVQAAVEVSSKQQHLAEDEPCFAVLVAWDAAADIQWSAHNSSKKQLPSTSCRHLTEHAKQHAISRSDGAVSCFLFVNTVCQHCLSTHLHRHLNRLLIDEGVPACSTSNDPVGW